ncbi:MAG: N-acetylmuramoyl-L-alanine amidase, partial [Bacteroidota bacterium]
YQEKYQDYDINSPAFVIGSTILQEEYLDQSIELAKEVQSNFITKLKRKDRKVKQAAFVVLHQTFMPSVLVELGFLTNKEEGAYLNSAKGQQDMSTAIADAIITYKKGVDANLVVTEDFGQRTPDETLEIQTSSTPIAETKETVTNTTISPPAVEAPKESKSKEVSVTEVVTKEVAEKPETPKTSETKTAQPAPSVPPKKVSDVIFKVQLLASSRSIPLEASNFNGLGELSSEPYQKMFRYLYGNTSDYEAAKKLKSDADAKGYNAAYIVAYRKGKRIPLDEALKENTAQ